MRRQRGQTWIRLAPMGLAAVSVWVRLGDGRMLLIKEDGSFEVTVDRGFCLPSFGPSGDGQIVRIA